jgi:hypothetical protein
MELQGPHRSPFIIGDIVTLKSGKPFHMDSELHELNPVYYLKVRRVDDFRVWVCYKIGWIHSDKLKLSNASGDSEPKQPKKTDR